MSFNTIKKKFPEPMQEPVPAGALPRPVVKGEGWGGALTSLSEARVPVAGAAHILREDLHFLECFWNIFCVEDFWFSIVSGFI